MKRKTALLAFVLCLLCLCSCVMNRGSEIPTVPTVQNATTELTSESPTEESETTTISEITIETQEPTETTEAPSGSIPSESSTFEIHFLDVGQADAALVLCDDGAMLIDGGNSEDSSLVYSYLNNHGIDHLEYIICTHPHEDHVGGLPGALNYATVGTAYCSMEDYDSKAFSSFERYLEQQGKTIEIPEVGDTFSLGSSTVSILGPVGYYSEANNMSIVLRIAYGNTSFLFSGDAEIDSEQDILNAGTALNSTLLKVGHHGSDTSTSYRWLREIAPEYAVISVGKGNSYGHPTEQTLSRLEDAEVTLFRTDLQGRIICTSDGETLSFSVERNANADTFYIEPTETVPAETQTTASEPSQTTYVLNTNSKKFHYPHCPSVDQMSAKNRKDVTLTRDEIVAMGYDSCGRCNP